MLKAGPAHRSAGFSLLELMMSILVLSLLLMLAMPSFQAWMRNIQIRNAAESVLSGIQRARAEAVARNTNVSFAMGADTSWTVSVVSPATVIDARPATEGSQDVTRSAPSGETTVTFGSLGTVSPNADGSATLTQVDFAASGGNQPMRILIGAGGNTRMCDPGLPPGSSVRAC